MPRKQLPPSFEPGTSVSARPQKGPGWEPVQTPEGPAWVRRHTQEERMDTELSIKGLFKIHKAPTDMGEEKALSLVQQMLDERHFELLLDETGLVATPDGEILCILLKDRLRQDLLDAVRPVVREAANHAVAGANRGDAAGTGMVPRENKNGTPSNMTGVPHIEQLSDEAYQRLKPAMHGTFGFNARDLRGGELYPCRLTKYDAADAEELALMSELAAEVAEAFRHSFAQQRWEAQFEKAGETPMAFVLKTPKGYTPFTTITCNNTWRTAGHIDKNDLKEGFGVMCSLGDFEGCDLVFPRYRTAVRYREGDILLANVHEVHGNSPLLNPDGSVPELDHEPERLVCVFYYEENMYLCEDNPEKDRKAVDKRKPGDPMYSRKSSKKSRKAAKAGS